tara:strand:+ start:16605 stop:18488 length:1884 start_codon:yes stop_codon:yes gene_type:complete
MTNNYKENIIYLKSSKFYLGKLIEHNQKNRSVLLKDFKDKDIVCKASSIVFSFNLNENKNNSIEDLDFLWKTLVDNHQLMNIDIFLEKSIQLLNIASLKSVEEFLNLLNSDFTYFKTVNLDKIYINNPEIVNKIKKKVMKEKDSIKENELFLVELKNWDKSYKEKFIAQIDNIVKYIKGKKKLNFKLIQDIKIKYDLRTDESFFNFLLDKKVFSLTELIEEKFDLKSAIISKNKYSDSYENSELIDAFTIDDESTYDYDDAFTVKKFDNYHEIYVHITNFSNLVPFESFEDLEARSRVQTIYSPIKNYNLYNDEILEQISLKEKTKRNVISIIFKIDLNLEILSFKISKNIANITKNYSYKEVDSDIKKNSDFILLNDFTTKVKQTRILNADFDEFNKDISIFLNSNNSLEVKVNNYNSYQIVSELMILTNSKIAQFMKDNEIPSIFRNQEVSNNLVIDSIDNENSFKFFRNVSPLIISTKSSPHHGLGLDSYVQFTSPIRRYHDSILMRQVNFYLEKSRSLFDEEFLKKTLQNLNSNFEISKNCSKNLYKFWVLKYLKENKIFNQTVYVYFELKKKYIIYFNKFNIFHDIDKDKLKKSYVLNDKIKIKYDSIDLLNMNFSNLEEFF